MPPAEIIDLTVSPQLEIVEISSEQENTAPAHQSRIRENNKRKRKKGKVSNGFSKDDISSSAQPSRAHSPDIGNKSGELNESIPQPKSASNLRQITPSTNDEPGLFFFDGVAAPIAADDSPPPSELVESNGDGNTLLLPSHVTIFHDNGPAPAEVIPPPKPSSDDEEYIEYLDYEDRKAPGLIRYFEIGEESHHPKPSIFKCKNCGAEGDHKTYECPVQICLTCGARDEHSTRSCPISKTCYTCGMKGHINKMCPNRFSASTVPSDFHGDCDRCGSTEHNMNECPTLWRIYQYVNDEERTLIIQSREQKKRLAIGEGGEAYIGEEMWCYNCADTGHLGDDCDELPHPATFPMEWSAFSSNNIMSGPFYDPATELVSIKHGRRMRENSVDRPRLPDDWDAGALVDVGKRGKNKDKERLEKRFREQEDEGEDWFNNIRNEKRGMDQQGPPPAPRGRRMKFGSFKDGSYELSSSPPSLPTSGSGLSLLARLGDAPGGRNRGKVDRGRGRHEPLQQPDNPIRIRGAANEQRFGPESRYASSHRVDWERGQESQDRRNRDRDRPGGSRRDHGPRYRGGYER